MLVNSLLKKKHLTSKVGFLIFLTALLLYSLVSPGNLPADTEIRWSVARQIVRGRGFSIEDTVQTRNCATGIDGKRYCFWGLGQSICFFPFAAFGLAIEKLLPVKVEMSDLTAQFLASTVLFPAIGALLVWLFYRLVVLLGYNKRAAILSSAVLAFATMNLHYSVKPQEQTQVAILLLIAIVLMIKNYLKPSFYYVWLLCVVSGVCLLFRLASIVMVLPIYLVGMGAEFLRPQEATRSKVILKWLAAGVLGTGGFVALIGWYNYIRFGSVFESGYRSAAFTALGGHNMFESNPFRTLPAMLFSPGKGILLYNPVIFLLPLAARDFYRRHRVVALAITAAIAGNFVFNSFHTTWAGDYAWSIRYQVSVLSLLILPLVELFNKPLKSWSKAVITSVIVVSGVIQLASVVYNFNLEFVQNPNHCTIPDKYVWDWSQSHLVKRFDNIIRHIAGRRDFSSVKVIDEEPILLKYNHSEESVRRAYCINFFPFKAKEFLPSAKLFYLLLSLWLVLLLAFCVAALKLKQTTSLYISQ